ncbi:MAG: hypothetical protein ABSH48_17700, partial [Verrucomicrobiota bacterium]
LEAQGCRRSGYLGAAFNKHLQPQSGCGLGLTRNTRRNRVAVEKFFPHQPKVVPLTGQPGLWGAIPLGLLIALSINFSESIHGCLLPYRNNLVTWPSL